MPGQEEQGVNPPYSRAGWVKLEAAPPTEKI